MQRSSAPAGAPVPGYEIVGPIGEGTTGAVFLAIHAASGQQVALKRLFADSTGGEDHAETQRRFIASTAIARGLDHPDIVRVLDAGSTAGNLWLAMELLPGCDLSRYTRPARLLPEAVVLRLGARIAGALAYAHERGVLHRDIKPTNIVVDWSSDRLTVTDFGLARDADAEQTRTGLVLGSPAYMAPEQLGGGQPTAATDLYALGVTLFELLAGRLPFDSHSLGDLLRSVATEPPPALSTLQPHLPEAISQAVARLLSKRAAQRGPDAATVSRELHALQAAVDSHSPR